MTRRILGSLVASTIDGVAFRDEGDRLVLTATKDLTGVASRQFDQPNVAASFLPTEFDHDDVSMVGFAYTQFAFRCGPAQVADSTSHRPTTCDHRRP